jgi:hypothetical protein
MKLSDKLAKVNDSFTINMYDNGFMLEISGRDHVEDWSTAKVMCSTLDQVQDLIKEVVSMPRD